jgi:hypothetical protein
MNEGKGSYQKARRRWLVSGENSAILILRFHDIKTMPRADLIIREQQLI